MICKLNKSNLLLCGVLLARFSCYTIFADSNQLGPVVQESPKDQTPNVMPNLLDTKKLDPEQIRNFFAKLQTMRLNEEKQRVAKIKEEVLLLLPESLSKRMTATQKHYFDFLESLTISHRLELLALQIDQALPLITDEGVKERKEVFAESLKKFRTALETGSFLNLFFPGYALAGMINNNAEDAFANLLGLIDGSPERPSGYSVEDAQKLQGDLFSFLKAYNDISLAPESKKELQKSLQDLLTMLGYVQQNKPAELAQFCVSLAEDQFDIMVREIDGIVQALAEFYVDCTAQNSPTLSEVDKTHQEGIQIWLNEFKSYKETIDSFVSLYKKSKLDLSFVILSLQRSIEIAAPLFYFYQFDFKRDKDGNTPYAYTTWMVDMALRLSLGGTMFFDQQGQNARELLVNKLLMKQPNGLHGFVNPLEQFEFGGAQLAVLSAQSFMPGMTMAKGHEPLPFFEKVLLQLVFVWAVYNCTEPYLDAKNGGGKGFLFWPKKYGPLRAVLYNAFKGMQAVAAYKIRDGIKNVANPAVLENLEFLSLGIISEDLVFSLSDILFQFIFCQFKEQTEKVIEFEDDDLFKYDYLFRINMNWKHGVYSSDRWENFREYVKYTLILHTSESVGKFCGTQIGYMASESIEDAVLKLTTALTNWLSGAHQKPEKLKREIAQGIFVLKMMIQMIMTDETAAPRIMLVNFLKNQNYIERDLNDPSLLNMELMRVCLFYLKSANLLNQAQFVTYVEKYEKNPSELKALIDEIFVAIKDNMTAAACGHFGKMLGTAVGGWIFCNIDNK